MRRNTCAVCLWDALGHALMHSAPWSILVSWYVSSSQTITIQCGDFRLSQLFLVLSLLGSKMRFYSQPLGLAWLRWQHDVFRHTHWPQCSFSSGTGLAHRCRFLLWKLSFCVAALGAQLVCKMFFSLLFMLGEFLQACRKSRNLNQTFSSSAKVMGPQRLLVKPVSVL